MKPLVRRVAPFGYGLLLWRIAATSRKAARKETSWLQLLLPCLAALELLRLQFGSGSRTSALAALVLAEVVLLTVALFSLRSSRADAHLPLEQRLAAGFALFLPDRLAQFGAAEATTLWMGLVWFAAKPDKQPGEFSYVAKTAIPYLPLIVLIGSVPESALAEVLLANRPLWVRVVPLVLTVWGLLWVCGISSLMARRPHKVEPAQVELHRGLAACSFDRSLIAEVAPEGSSRSLRRRGKLGKFSVGGAETIHLFLSEPVAMRTMFGNVRWVSELRVSADELAAFRLALAGEHF